MSDRDTAENARACVEGRQHCWHLTHTLTVDPPIAVRTCCWCGNTRQDPSPHWPPRWHGTRAFVAYGYLLAGGPMPDPADYQGVRNAD